MVILYVRQPGHGQADELEQRFRRRLLALGNVTAERGRLRGRFAEFLIDVRAAPIERRPYPDDVRDVLLASGLPRELVDELCSLFEREIWAARLRG